MHTSNTHRAVRLVHLGRPRAAWINRCIGHALGAPLADVLVGDMLIGTAMSVITAVILVGWIGRVAVVFGVGTIVGALLPHAAPTVLAICQCAVWLLALRALLIPGVLVVAPAIATRSSHGSHSTLGEP